ncbi:MAG: hypothetical protein HUU46_07370 [Candidatus Hydrogenedentes bacterium]|nr:hypothetical protein [Candidatus Hydrogenedentota bacterium]
MQDVIDGPLDRAANAFLRAVKTEEGSQLDGLPLSRVAGQILRCLCSHGMQVPREISQEQAERDAVEIIQRRYPGPAGEEFDAMLVAYEAQGSQAISFLVLFLVGAVKQSERQKHLRWALNGVIDPMDRQARKDIICLLFETIGKHLPPSITAGKPEDFVDSLSHLLKDYIEIRNELIRSLRGA